MVLRAGIEPASEAYKTPASPLMLTEQILESRVGFEPTIYTVLQTVAFGLSAT